MIPVTSDSKSSNSSSTKHRMTPTTPSGGAVRGVVRMASDDSFGGFDDNMAWADQLLEGDDDDEDDDDVAKALAGWSKTSLKKTSGADDAGATMPMTRQVSASTADWFTVHQESSISDRAGAATKDSHHHSNNKSRSNPSLPAIPSPQTTPSQLSRGAKTHSSHSSKGEKRSSQQRRSTSDGNLIDEDKQVDASDNSHCKLPTPEEIKRAEEILRLAAKNKADPKSSGRPTTRNKSDGHHSSDGDDDHLRRRKSETNSDEISSGKSRRSADKSGKGDAADVNAAESDAGSKNSKRLPKQHDEATADEIPRYSRRPDKSSRRHSDEADRSKEFSKPKREKSLEDMMGAHAVTDHSESDMEDGSVVSKTRQTARRGRPTRRQSTATDTVDRSLSRSVHGPVPDRSLSRRRRASVATGGVDEIRARSLSRTKRRGSMNAAQPAPKTIERSMLGDHSDSEQNEDDDLDFEAMKRRDILNQSRRGPIVYDTMRNSSNNAEQHASVAGQSIQGFQDDSGDFSQSSANSPQRTRKQVSTNDWERGLDDVLGRRQAARDGSNHFVPGAEDISPRSQRQSTSDSNKYGDDRRGSNSAAALAGPKADLSKMTVPIASPSVTKKKGWGSRLQQIGAKGKERKNAV